MWEIGCAEKVGSMKTKIRPSEFAITENDAPEMPRIPALLLPPPRPPLPLEEGPQQAVCVRESGLARGLPVICVLSPRAPLLVGGRDPMSCGWLGKMMSWKENTQPSQVDSSPNFPKRKYSSFPLSHRTLRPSWLHKRIDIF